jgi:hypothetical protein
MLARVILAEVTHRSRLERPGSQPRFVLHAEDQHRQYGSEGAYFGEDVNAALVRQVEVQDEHIPRAVAHLLDRLGAAGRFTGDEDFGGIAEVLADAIADDLMAVRHQDLDGGPLGLATGRIWNRHRCILS